MRKRPNGYLQPTVVSVFTGAVQRDKSYRLTHRAMFRTMDGGDRPGQRRPGKAWARCPTEYIAVFKAKSRSIKTNHLLFGVAIVLWARAVKRLASVAGGSSKRRMGPWRDGSGPRGRIAGKGMHTRGRTIEGREGNSGRGRQPY